MLFFSATEKDSFQEDYLDFLISENSGKEETLKTLLSIAIEHPQFKPKLQAFYKENFPTMPFDSYWRNYLKTRLPDASSISLTQLDGKVFRLADLPGRWILLDFWGTWCAPCLKEMPVIDKFNKELSINKMENLSVLTIACKDKPETVQAFISKNKYSFPVAMSDNVVEKSFKINGYPSKILITPDRKYFLVPREESWVEFIEGHIGMEL
jgi:thiol-disulfide isomerase/thioredoxin